MRVLLDTNILIHREASRVVRDDIGILFHWLDRLGYAKCVHPLSVAEITSHQDPTVVRTMIAKLQSYVQLKTTAPDSAKLQEIRTKYDRKMNDGVDTALVNEVYCSRVDALITEDRRIHAKAEELGVRERIFTIDGFLEKVTAENPDLADYKVLSVRKQLFGTIDLDDPFFSSFKEDYTQFSRWFARKSDEVAYTCRGDDGRLLAFLYLKREDQNEAYPDIEPRFAPKRRLKIGTFKVILNGFKLGERFLKIAFDNALLWRVDEIYVTIFQKRVDQERLVELLADWGFRYHGTKRSEDGEESVYVHSFVPEVYRERPAMTYPFMSGGARKFIVPIYPEYHTELLPDSILRTESPLDFVENRPNRNAIRKAYISRSFRRDMSPGDIIIFYRTKMGGPAHYTAVATTLGIIEQVTTQIPDLQRFLEVCRKRTVFSDAELKNHWDYNPLSRPFVVNFLYVHSFPIRPNLASLKAHHIITDAPRGFEPITDDAFRILLEISHAEKRLVVD